MQLLTIAPLLEWIYPSPAPTSPAPTSPAPTSRMIGMNDKTELAAMFDRAGVPYAIRENVLSLEVDSLESNKLGGYHEFTTDFHFSEEGNLVKVMIWE